MKILILNWRDPSNPKSGGAENVLEQYAGHWISQGHQVWWLGNRYKGSKSVDNFAGINIIRIGPNLSFYDTLLMLITYPAFFVQASIYIFRLVQKERFDLVIDAIHGLPWFTPLYLRNKIALFVCEVAGPIWDKMYPYPINLIGNILERIVYKIYQKCEIWAISQSTRRDILNINPNLHVSVLPLGIDVSKFKPAKKFPFPSAVFVARLVKMKGIESALTAAKQIAQKLPNFKLFVVGGGNADYVTKLDHRSYVEHVGRVSDAERNKLYARCHFLIHPSYKEGFGLTVLEAGASGTPTIARKGSSMDELIEHGISGLLFDHDDQIAKLFLQYYGTSKYLQLVRSAKAKVLNYDWQQIFKNNSRL